MKKILIAFFICALCFSAVQGQKITLLTESTAIDGNALMMTREGSTGNVIKKITIANIFKDRIFTGTIVFPSTTTIAGKTVPRIVGDTLTARIAAARPFNDLIPGWADTTNAPGGIMTYNQAQNLLGGGGGGGAATIFKLQFIVNVTTGAPLNNATTFTHTNYIGKHIEVFRGAPGAVHKLYYNEPASNGFSFNNSTGTITFDPALATKEQVVIESTNTITWTNLSIEGQASGLLTNLRAYWALSEVSGTLVNDSHTGGFNGTTNAQVNQPGKIGVAETFTGTSSQRIDFGTTVGDVGTSDFTVAAWIYQPALLESWTGIVGNWGSYPWFYIQTTNEAILNGVINFTGTTYDIYTNNNTVLAATWQHIAMVADRDGNLTLYFNGIAQTDVLDISAFSAVSITNNNTFSVGSIGNSQPNSYFTGTIDEVYFALRVLSAGEIQELMTKTYPFAEYLWLILLLLPNYKRKFKIAA